MTDPKPKTWTDDDTNRTTIWIFLVLGGMAYQWLKIVFGYEPKWEDVFDCAWWSGLALLWHWCFGIGMKTRGPADRNPMYGRGTTLVDNGRRHDDRPEA